MTPQERDLLTRFLDDLVRANPGPKDQEAADQIDRTLRANPNASYVLVQHAIVADAALRDAQAEVAELQRRLRDPDGAGGRPPGEEPSFLGSLFGRARPNAQAPGAPQGNAGPWSGGSAVPATGGPSYGASGYGASGYGAPVFGSSPFSGGGGLGSFLRTAGTTAAGVAGGAFLFEGLRDLFGGGEHGQGFGGFDDRQGFADAGAPDMGADMGGGDMDVSSDDGGFGGDDSQF